METQTKEVVTKTVNLPSSDVFAMQDNETVDFDTSDILIPKLLLMQGPSQLVAEGKCQQGDMVNSVTGEILGNKAKPINFIPLTTFKQMTVMREKEGMYVYDHVEAWTPAHANKGIEAELIDGVLYKNYATLNFYVMLEEDLKTKASTMPVLLSFKSTSNRAGKKLISLFAQAADIKKQPCALVATLTCVIQKGPKGPYHAFDVKLAGETPREYGPKIVRWVNLLKQTKVKVHDENEDAEPTFP